MSDNPYQSGPGGYTTSMQFGETAAAPNGPASSADPVKDTTTSGFSADVIQESRNQPVLVDFWAPWCGPCRQLTPVLEKVVREARGRVKLVKMNIDDHPAIPGQLGIQSIPAVIAFKDGQPFDGFMGAQPESEIRAFIDKVAGGAAPDPLADALAGAAEAAQNGDVQSAMQIYSAVLGQDSENVEALGAAATILYDNGDREQASDLLGRVPQGKENTEAIVALKARMALDEEVSALGDPMDLARRLADNPKDHEARLDLAKIENARGEREKAADHLLAIIRDDRHWNEDAARNQLLQFFEAWGPADELTLSVRRRLSSVLFS